VPGRIYYADTVPQLELSLPFYDIGRISHSSEFSSARVNIRMRRSLSPNVHYTTSQVAPGRRHRHAFKLEGRPAIRIMRYINQHTPRASFNFNSTSTRGCSTMTFPTRKMGGVSVSAIGFGAMGIGGAYGAVGDDEERFKVFIHPSIQIPIPRQYRQYYYRGRLISRAGPRRSI
jgi:hypothetical protein